MCVVWNYEQSGGPFKLSKKRVMHAKKKKKETPLSFPSALMKTKQSRAPWSNLPLFHSPLLSLTSRGRNSYHVTFFTTTSSVWVSSFDNQIYIHTTYTFVVYLSAAAEFIRAHILLFYAHTNRRKDGQDDQQQQRGDDDDDDEKKSSSQYVLSIWRKIFCFQY